MTALRLEEPDRVPYLDFINNTSILKICKELYDEDIDFDGVESWSGSVDNYEIYDRLIRITRDLDIDAIATETIPGLEKIRGKENLASDPFGNIYRLSSHGEPVPFTGGVRGKSDLDRVSKVRPNEEDFSVFRYIKENAPERIAIYLIGDPFKLSWKFIGGMEKLLPIYVTEPDFVRRLARISTDFVLTEMHMAIEKGADVLIVDGDLAYEKTTLMSPKMFREFIKPYYFEFTELAHKYNVPIIKHSDGNFLPILDDLVEVGFDGLHPFEPQCMDISEAKKKLTGKICVCGNIDCTYLLPFGTPEEVRLSVRETIKAIAPGGGYILTSSNSIHPGCKAGNAIAMIKAAKEFGQYPIRIK
jgi:uroporphyrinogen decarboxylase